MDSRRFSGTIKAYISLRAKQPLYIVGGFGGAAALVADLLEGRPRHEFTWNFQKAAPYSIEMRKIYEARGPAWDDYSAMADVLAQTGVRGLSEINRLAPDENRELFLTRDVGRIVSLLIAGLARI